MVSSPIPAWARNRPKDDWEEGRKTYYQIRARECNEARIRQYLRKIRVQEIEAAPVVMVGGEPTILGEPWFSAWLTTTVFLAVEGRFKDMVADPREWLAEKLQQDLIVVEEQNEDSDVE